MNIFEKLAYKLIFGKTHTGSNKNLFNERYNSAPIILAETIWADKVDRTSPTSVNNKDIVSPLLDLQLIKIDNGNSYFCTLGDEVPISLQNKTNHLTGDIFKPFDRVGNIIPINFGFEFRPRLFNSKQEINVFDSCNWAIDNYAGIIIQEGDCEFIKLKAYIYIGRTGIINNYEPSSKSNIVFYDHQYLGEGISQISNKTYSIDHLPDQNSLHLFINGILQKNMVDYILSDKIIKLSDTIEIEPDDFLTISYRTTV